MRVASFSGTIDHDIASIWLHENMEESLDVVVIGAGVVGLAIARELALAGREVIVLERHASAGEETSSRNSEVIHAGIYYQTNSLKARLCVAGRRLLYRYCDRKNVPYRRCGKLIVALSEGQQSRLSDLHAQAKINGVDDLEWLSQQEAAVLEPSVRCEAGLLSPSTGILDSHHYMLALQGDLEEAGGRVAFLSEFVQGEIGDEAIQLTVRSDGNDHQFRANCVVNSAGLAATAVASGFAGLDAKHNLRTRFAKGTYFVYQKKHPFNHLVYPLPEGAGLGVHVTIDLAGRARFGPDSEWVDEIDYRVDPSKLDSFYTAIRTYWPDLPDDSLAPGYVGTRPKIVGPGEPAGDFVIQGPATHGIPGLVNLFGIESPGLTSSLAIGEEVRKELSL